ncbi:tyrosine-type recombinase/integrase [Paraglaciecola marina]|uniref:phage integrase n=1 Tax=Paraglaciecola marina TaxID=2500157 RepID=UPI00105CDEEA|nr:tyrosine-type recombinase/integrase [Paraglaciecola marina]
MSIKKQKDGRYKLEIYPDGREGKRVRKLFETKSEAIRYERHILDSANNDPWNKKEIIDNRKLSELAKRYYELYGKSLKDSVNAMRYINRTVAALNDPKGIDLTKAIYTEYRTQKIKDGFKNNTLNNELMRIKGMFNKLFELKDIHYKPPLLGLKKLKVDDAEKTYLELPELKILMEALKKANNDCYMTAKLCASTGARWGEAESMESRRLKKYSVYYSKTKSARNRTVGITSDFYNELPKKRGLIFSPTYKVFLAVFHGLKLDVPKGQATHILRHTFATHFMKNGGNILDLQKILGHSDIKMTMIYAHHSPEYTEHAIKLNPIAKILE